jgi:hypothetical protein
LKGDINEYRLFEFQADDGLIKHLGYSRADEGFNQAGIPKRLKQVTLSFYLSQEN